MPVPPDARDPSLEPLRGQMATAAIETKRTILPFPTAWRTGEPAAVGSQYEVGGGLVRLVSHIAPGLLAVCRPVWLAQLLVWTASPELARWPSDESGAQPRGAAC